jgi:hypothetical protein
MMVCEYCKYTLTNVPIAGIIDGDPLPPGPAEERWGDASNPRVVVAGRRFVVIGRLGKGDGSDAFLGRTDARLTEMVVLKVARALEDGDLLAREWRTLEALSESRAQGSEYFTQLLPQQVLRGTSETPDGLKRTASVFRWRSGFIHTFEDIARVYTGGIDGQTAVWLWKRTLELLGWIHQSGYVHGAVLPQHLLVHPRDHGVVLVGWSCATSLHGRDRLPAVSAASSAYYPDHLWSELRPDPRADLVMSARCLIRALGGDPSRGSVPGFVPARLAELISTTAAPPSWAGLTDDAWELKERVSAAAHEGFGSPKYHPFRMPGWS